MSSTQDSLAPARNRVLCLTGGCNFRDIGGYRTRDGHQIQWGQVYRAGVLAYVTTDDHQTLNSLGIRTICDLRRQEERAKEPTVWPDATTRTLHWDDATDTQTLRKHAAEQPPTAEGMFNAMLALYRGLPSRMSARIRGLMNSIIQGDLPLVVHCAAGKDRTGVAIAVLLAALDVPRDVIIEDYVLTNEVGNFESFIRGREHAELGLADAKHPLLAMPEDVRRVVFSADPRFLDAAFTAIDDAGGLERYLADALGIDARLRAKLGAALLT